MPKEAIQHHEGSACMQIPARKAGGEDLRCRLIGQPEGPHQGTGHESAGQWNMKSSMVAHERFKSVRLEQRLGNASSNHASITAFGGRFCWLMAQTDLKTHNRPVNRKTHPGAQKSLVQWTPPLYIRGLLAGSASVPVIARFPVKTSCLAE